MIEATENEVRTTREGIAASAIVKHATLGTNTKIWHHCNIYGAEKEPIRIGDNCQIGSFSEIKPGVHIGNNCRLQSYVFIPEGITVEDNVFIGPQVSFTNDKYPTATAAAAKTWILEKTTVKHNTSIGAGAIIGSGITIGKHAVVGMGAVVVKDVPDYAIVVGNPAKVVGDSREGRYQEKFFSGTRKEENSEIVAVPFVDLKRSHNTIKEEIDGAIQNVIRTNAYIQGQDVAVFEQEFAQFCEKKYAVGVGSGTDALQLTIKAYDIEHGEIITSANTFIATLLAIKHTKNIPVLVDVDETGNIDPEKIEEKITPKTKAIIPVHLYGQPADMTRINTIAKKHNLIIIEDACQAHGARVANKKTPITETGCFSFYPAKNLGAFGDAGMIVTDNQRIYEKLKLMREYGAREKYYHELPDGWNSRLDTLQAAILRVKLQHLPLWTKQRQEAAAQYTQQLSTVSQIRLPQLYSMTSHVYHLFTLLTPQRDTVKDFLKTKGIATAIHYPLPPHQQKMFSYLGYKQRDFPVTEQFCKETLSLPLFPYITEQEITYVCDAVKEFFRGRL